MSRSSSKRRQRRARRQPAKNALHRIVIDHASLMTDGLAIESHDMDSYLLALIQLVICRAIPCRLSTIMDLRRIAAAEGYE